MKRVASTFKRSKVTGERAMSTEQSAAAAPVPDLAIGSAVWPGLAKLAEECGELQQVIGKIIAYPEGRHPDGTNVIKRLHDELADVLAGASFVIEANPELVDPGFIEDRRNEKLVRFHGWHADKVLPADLTGERG